MGGHSLADVRAQVGDLVVDVRQERQARPAASFHDLDHVAAIELHCHGAACSQRVRPGVFGPDPLASESEVA